jgi:N-methylhydantoinase A
MSSIRVGIDVGGTFTHAVAFDLSAFQLLGAHKVPTTHTATEGVGLGIVQALEGLLESCALAPAHVGLIAHSTTQATNALLEGDTARVGVLGMGGGLLSWRARSQTAVPPMALAPGKVLETLHAWLSTDERLSTERIEVALRKLHEAGAEVFVVAEAFGVDDAAHEERACTVADRMGLSATAASGLSQTYGLRLRARTACVNASILPRMMAAATMTESSVHALWKRKAEEAEEARRQAAEIAAAANDEEPESGDDPADEAHTSPPELEAALTPPPPDVGDPPPVMIMRSDGGIMGIDEMRRRPILTILSGPAAGVAAALRYSRISDGIFLEVGGTSTDISVIKDGRARHRAASVGGHSLHLKTLDVRTVGVAGGSLALSDGKKLLAVGPRSAHIAGVRYAAFTPGIRADDVRPALLRPDGGAKGPGWWCFRLGDAPELYAVTPSCAANVLGLVPEGVEARGDVESVRQALTGLARSLGGGTPESIAESLLALGVGPIEQVVRRMIADYKLDTDLMVLCGGGGGAWAWVPYLAKKLSMRFEVVAHAPVISAIGCATGLLRETLERSVINPTESDLLGIRREVQEKLVAMGGARDTITVEVEIDTRKNVLRAVGSGSTQMALREAPPVPPAALAQHAIEGLRPLKDPLVLGSTGRLTLFALTVPSAWSVFGNRPADLVRVLDASGVVRWQRKGARALTAAAANMESKLEGFLEEHATYGDSGRELPELFLVYREQVLDLSGLVNPRQVAAMAKAELEGLPSSEPVFALATPRS